MPELFFLISLNNDSRGNPVQFVTNHGQWKGLLISARANGWAPQGTILDYEFQYRLEMSLYDEIDHGRRAVIEQQVTDRCEGWHGDYLTPEYQVVTNEDAEGLRTALERTTAPSDLLVFLSYGAFRIAR